MQPPCPPPTLQGCPGTAQTLGSFHACCRELSVQWCLCARDICLHGSGSDPQAALTPLAPQ